MARRLKQIFLQRRHKDSQEAHEKIFNITNYEMQMRHHLTPVKMDTCTLMFIAALFPRAKARKQPKRHQQRNG